MARMAVIFNGIVENIIEADNSFQLPDRQIVYADENAHIGGGYAHGVFTPQPAPPEPSPQELREAMPTLTPRQVKLMLLNIGVAPEMIDAQIAAMTDAETRAVAQIEWSSATYFRRTHPLLLQIAAAIGLTDPVQVDALWLAALDL